MNTSQKPVTMTQLGCIPTDENVFSWVGWGEYLAHTYTNWREETLSWKTSCLYFSFSFLLSDLDDCRYRCNSFYFRSFCE